MAKKTVKKYLVEAPNKDFVGVGAAGVQFAYGKAVVHEGWVLEWYKEHGYKVTEYKANDAANVIEPKEDAE